MYNTAVPTHSLYIHWPFCPYKCHFCPFVALASHDQFMEQYHTVLVQEIERYAAFCTRKQEIKTIYIGGGTPSTYPCALLLDMFDTLRKVFTIKPDAEITIEVNPGTVQSEQFMIWKQAGINRLSIGVQSLNDKVLRSLNRHQSIDDVTWLLHEARAFFDNLSIDLILGLPDVSQEEWKDIIKTVVQWPITHISIYFLTIHENTPLYFKVKKRAVTLPADDTMVDLYHWTVDFLEHHNIVRYELSNFSRPTYESQHNTVYWDREAFKGFGLGACSFDGMQRLQNEKRLMEYLEKGKKDEDLTTFSECLTDDQIYLERLMLGLRRSKGVSFEALAQGMPFARKDLLQERLNLLVRNGFLVEQNNVFVLTPQGLMVENEIVTQLSVLRA
jgi:oxygen-independent coproporphyrinogen III oxidase